MWEEKDGTGDFYFDKQTHLLHRLDWRGDFYSLQRVEGA